MPLVPSESSLIKGAIAVLEMTLSFQQICLELSYIKRILLGEFEFPDAASDTILPLSLVEVAIWPSVNSNTIRLVIVIVPEVNAFICVDIPPQPILFIALPEALVLRPS